MGRVDIDAKEEKRGNQNLQSRQMSPNMEEHRLTHE